MRSCVKNAASCRSSTSRGVASPLTGGAYPAARLISATVERPKDSARPGPEATCQPHWRPGPGALGPGPEPAYPYRRADLGPGRLHAPKKGWRPPPTHTPAPRPRSRHRHPGSARTKRPPRGGPAPREGGGGRGRGGWRPQRSVGWGADRHGGRRRGGGRAAAGGTLRLGRRRGGSVRNGLGLRHEQEKPRPQKVE